MDLPVGYRFSPTDEELISFFLMRKINNQPLPPYNVKELDIYRYTPEELEVQYGARRENEMYLITKRKVNNATASRPSRTIPNAGFWKASTKRTSITNYNGDVIGYKMLLNYFLSKGNITSWLMYEYTTPSGSKKMDEMVLCKVYNKRNGQKYKVNAQREGPRQNVEPQALAYQVGGVIRLHEENVKSLAPTDRAELQSVQPQMPNCEFSANECFRIEDIKGEMVLMKELLGETDLMDFRKELNVCDYQPLMVQAPTYQYNDSSAADEPINAAGQYLTPQAQDIATYDDAHFAQSLEEQLQEPACDTTTQADLQSKSLAGTTKRTCLQHCNSW